VRAISLPTALPVAAAAFAIVAAVLAPLAVPSAALAERWLRPVPGDVARPFEYSRAAPFAGGAHRGVDLAAPPGTVVRSACAGSVVHAGAVAGPDEVVSVRCGNRRVSYLPLASVAVREGAKIREGATLGTLAPGHAGLHLGVRRENDRFGYEDPAALLRSPAPATPPLAAPPSRPARPRLAPPPIVRPARPRLAPRPAGRPTPALRPAPRVAAWPATSPRPLAGRAPSSLARWPVWLGLAVLLAGAVGSRTLVVRRRDARSHALEVASVQSG
jgi:murein DD-endopeptidase MepM/ murein hydrolase activator NlpD